MTNDNKTFEMQIKKLEQICLIAYEAEITGSKDLSESLDGLYSKMVDQLGSEAESSMSDS